MPERSRVRLDVYNILGQRVATPLDAEYSAGTYRLDWDARYAGGGSLPSGVYFYRLSAGDEVRTQRMVMLR